MGLQAVRTIVRRFDYASALAPPEKRPDGFVKVAARIARVGVQAYQNADGSTRRELRLPEEVFSPKSIASFAGVPLTNTHPPQLLDATTAPRYTAGSVVEVKKDGAEWLGASLMITDAGAIAAAEAGRVQVSVGYSCELAPRDPALVAKWGEHDCIQRGIVANHVAIVDQARAGDGARLRLDRLDASDAIAVTTITRADARRKDRPMGKKKTDQLNVAGQDYDRADPKLQDAIDALAVERDQTKAQLDALSSRIVECDACKGEGMVDGEECDACDGTGERLKGRADDDSDGDDDVDEGEDRADSFQRRVDARVALELQARRILGDRAELRGLTDAGVRRLVLEAVDPSLKDRLDSLGSTYARARFDAEMAHLDRQPTAADRARAAALGARGGGRARADAKPTNPTAARGTWTERVRTAWMRPEQKKAREDAASRPSRTPEEARQAMHDRMSAKPKPDAVTGEEQ